VTRDLDLKNSIEYYLGMDTTNPEKQKSGLFSFLKGFASAFDITGQTFMDDLPDFSGGFARDARVIRGDWERVGNALKKAMSQVSYGQ
jgi:hypothetical protein